MRGKHSLLHKGPQGQLTQVVVILGLADLLIGTTLSFSQAVHLPRCLLSPEFCVGNDEVSEMDEVLECSFLFLSPLNIQCSPTKLCASKMFCPLLSLSLNEWFREKEATLATDA